MKFADRNFATGLWADWQYHIHESNLSYDTDHEKIAVADHRIVLLGGRQPRERGG